MSDTRAMRLRHFCLLTAAFLALASAAAAPGATKASLSIRDDLPLTLHGSGFRPHESVRLTVVIGERRWTRLTRAGAAGGFTIQFAGVRLDYCATPLAITARGASSATVRAKIPIRECAAP
jgi:hypothetical protein